MYRDYRAKRKYIEKQKVAAMQDTKLGSVRKQSEVEVLLTKADLIRTSKGIAAMRLKQRGIRKRKLIGSTIDKAD